MLAGAALVATEVEETTASHQTEGLPLSLARLQALLVEAVGAMRGARPHVFRLTSHYLRGVPYAIVEERLVYGATVNQSCGSAVFRAVLARRPTWCDVTLV